MTEKANTFDLVYVEPRADLVRYRDEATWTYLYTVLRTPVIRSICHILYDRLAAEDLYQKTFMHAFQAAADWGNRENNNFRAWIYNIARAKTIDELQYRRRWDRLVVGYLSEDTPGLKGWVDKRDDESERRRIIDEAFSRLPANYRLVTRLRYSDNLTISEIAQRTGLKISGVNGRLRRAEKVLAQNQILVEYFQESMRE